MISAELQFKSIFSFGVGWYHNTGIDGIVKKICGQSHSKCQ